MLVHRNGLVVSNSVIYGCIGLIVNTHVRITTVHVHMYVRSWILGVNTSSIPMRGQIKGSERSLNQL